MSHFNFTNSTISSNSTTFTPGGGTTYNLNGATFSLVGDEVDDDNIYGSETINGNIKKTASIRLEGTTVNGNVHSTGDSIRANNATFQKGKATGSIKLEKSNATSLKSTSSIKVKESKVLLSLRSCTGSVKATQCSCLGHIKALKSSKVIDCESVASIESSKVTVMNSTISGNVTTQKEAVIIKATINGTLSCSIRNTRIKDSTIGTIKVEAPKLRITNLNIPGIRMNGGTITGGTIIIGGVNITQQMRQQRAASNEPTPKQVLELDNTTVRDVRFEGGNGEVILKNGATVTGTVHGGKIASDMESQLFGLKI